MSEHDDRYVRNDLPRTTGEFRAMPDASASTAQFKAFAAGQDSQPGPGGATSWPEQPWAGETARRGSGRTVLLILAAVLVIAILVAVFLIG